MRRKAGPNHPSFIVNTRPTSLSPFGSSSRGAVPTSWPKLHTSKSTYHNPFGLPGYPMSVNGQLVHSPLFKSSNFDDLGLDMNNYDKIWEIWSKDVRSKILPHQLPEIQTILSTNSFFSGTRVLLRPTLGFTHQISFQVNLQPKPSH